MVNPGQRALSGSDVVGYLGMGCSASLVLLQALRSVGRANCAHMCSRQDQLSLDALPPGEGHAATGGSRALTIVVMVTNIRLRSCRLQPPFFLCWGGGGGGGSVRGLEGICLGSFCFWIRVFAMWY